MDASRHSLTAAVCCRAALMAACLCFLYAAVVLCLWFWPLAVLGLVAACWYGRRWRGTGYAYGTARLADLDDLHAADLLGDEGLILARAGHALPPSRLRAARKLFTAPLSRSDVACRLFLAAFGHRRWGGDSLIRLRRFHHLATFAPPGAGKGVGVVIPNLLTYPGSCVVIDPKGENYRLTAAHRRRAFGHQVVRIDPFDVVRRHPGGRGAPPPDSFNPFDLIPRSSPDFIDRAAELANALVIRNPEEREPHWSDSAEMYLTAFIAFVLAQAPPRERNLQTVRELLANPEAVEGAINLMRQSGAGNRMLRRRAGQLTYFIERERGSVLTSVGRHTSFLDSESIAATTERSSFDPGRLLSGRMTVYVCLPEDQLQTQAGFLRLVLASLLRCVTRGGPQERNLVLFLLDEAGHIGHMRCLEDAITLLRGYGVRLWFIFQSLGQLEETFRAKAKAFLDAIDTQQFFGLNGLPSAELVSNRIGDATIEISSYQQSQGRSSGHSTGGGYSENASSSTTGSTTYSEIGRRLLQPAEVLRLPPDQAIIFTRGAPPIVGTLVRYYDAPEFGPGRPGGSSRSTLAMAAAAGALLLLGLMLAAFATVWPSEVRGPAAARPIPWQAAPGVRGFPAGPRAPSSPRPPLLEVPPGHAPLQGQGGVPGKPPPRVP